MCIACLPSQQPEESWGDIWQRKAKPAGEPHSVADLIAIDGYPAAIRSVLREYASLVKVTHEDVVCDIGAGSGAFLHLLPGFGLAVAADLSAAMLEVSQTFVKRYHPHAKVIHVCNSAIDLWKLPSAFCDVTVVVSVLQYLPDINHVQRAARELERITRVGGKIHIFDLRDGDPQAYRDQRAKAGLTHTTPHLFVPRSFWGPAWRVQEASRLAHRLYYNANFSYSVERLV